MQIATDTEMKQFGARVGRLLRGGEMIELVGDVGAGKTTFTKGLGEGLQVDDDVQSPTFTISREYQARDGLQLHHYDFYRLQEAGVVSYELAESVADPGVVTVVEWAETVQSVLPENRITITLKHSENEGRECEVTLPADHQYLQEAFA